MKKHALRRLKASLGTEPCLFLDSSALDQLAAGVWNFSRPAEVVAEVRRDVAASDDEEEPGDTRAILTGERIAVVPIIGVLTQRPTWYGTGLEQLEQTLHGLVGDNRVKGVVLFLDTPGGSAMGTEEVAEAIAAVRTAGKPVVAYIKGMAASAGYYLASQAEKIVASKSSMAGSIGVVIAHMEIADMLQKYGVGINVITHGANKWAANPYQKLSERGRAELQRTVTSFGKLFDEAVARGRGVSVEHVKNKFGQGSMFLAEEAVAIGLIDAVGSLADVVAGLKARLESQDPTREQVRSAGHAGHGEGQGSAPLRTSLERLASAPAAGASAAMVTPPAGTAKESTVNKKIKAALFARGLIESIEASDEICKAALAAWFSGQGKAIPAAEEEILAGINGGPAASGAAGAGKPADNVAAAHQKEMDEARAAAKKEAQEQERQRITNLQASGRTLGIDAKGIEEAIASGQRDDEIIAGWVKQKAKQEPPVAAGDVRVTGEGADRFMADALVGLQLRCSAKVDAKLVTADTRRMSQAPLWVLASQCLAMSGMRVDAYATPEDVAEAALGMDQTRRNISPNALTIRPTADDPAYNRPGSFPNLLSNLANKVLDEGLELAAPTYPEWCGKFAGDLPDFKPAPIVNKSQVDELDTVTDAEALKELGLSEEMLAYIQIGRFANKFAWTPVLIANDDLNAFMEGMLGLSGAHENTLNRLCLSQITGNVTLLDGVALFDDTSHGNDVASGAAPSDSQWSAMDDKVAAQRGVGGTGYLRAPLGIALVPPKLERAAIQTFATPTVTVEVKQPATDANVNIYRGKVKIVREPELAAHSDVKWYGLVQPRGTLNATVIYAFFRGWGQGGRRETWYDPNTKCRYVSLEGRFAAAAKQYRTAVRNAGE